MGTQKRSEPQISISKTARLKCICSNHSIISWSFPFMFAVKHSSRPSTKLTLVLLAKFRPYDVKMSHAMRIMVSVH